MTQAIEPSDYNQEESRPKQDSPMTAREITLIVGGVLLSLLLYSIVIVALIPIEWHAKAYSFGVFSKIAFVLSFFCILLFTLVAIHQKSLISSITYIAWGVICSASFFCGSAHFAFTFVDEGHTYFNNVASELGCYPDSWMFIVEDYNLEYDSAKLCSQHIN